MPAERPWMSSRHCSQSPTRSFHPPWEPESSHLAVISTWFSTSRGRCQCATRWCSPEASEASTRPWWYGVSIEHMDRQAESTKKKKKRQKKQPTKQRKHQRGGEGGEAPGGGGGGGLKNPSPELGCDSLA